MTQLRAAAQAFGNIKTPDKTVFVPCALCLVPCFQGSYDRPPNVFVAAFIGWPSMNLLPVKVNGQGGVDSSGNHWNVSHIPAKSSQALTLGMRPEHLRLDEAGVVEARVPVVQLT